MKLAIAITATFFVALLLYVANDDNRARHQLDQARTERDAALVRVAVLQGQIDVRAKADRELEERERASTKIWEDEHFKEMQAETSRLLQESWDRYECEHDAGCFGAAAKR